MSKINLSNKVHISILSLPNHLYPNLFLETRRLAAYAGCSSAKSSKLLARSWEKNRDSMTRDLVALYCNITFYLHT